MSIYITTCINPTEIAVFKHNSHIRTNRLVPVLTWPDNRGRTVPYFSPLTSRVHWCCAIRSPPLMFQPLTLPPPPARKEQQLIMIYVSVLF